MLEFKSALLFVAAHWAMLSGAAVLLGRAFAPFVAPFVKSKMPRVAHICSALAAMSPDLVPAFKALFRAFTGQPFDGAAK